MTKLSFLILGLTLLFYNNTFNNRAKDKSCEVEIIAVGDNLIHNSVLNSGKINDSTYNFDRLFDIMRNDFQKADIAITNQETILATPPRCTAPSTPYNPCPCMPLLSTLPE